MVKESNQSSRLFNIGVVGDAEILPGSKKEALALAIGDKIVSRGHRILCGGGEGVMAAVCLGARRSAAYFSGATIGILPEGTASAANSFVDIAIPTSLGHGRNQIVAQSDAVVAIGGGAGTLSEMAFAWIYGRLIIGVCAGGWGEKLAGTKIDARVRYPNISEDQVYPANTAEDVVGLLDKYLAAYTNGQ